LIIQTRQVIVIGIEREMTMIIQRPLTAAKVREIAKESGLVHAEFCVERAESQFGTGALKAARKELSRLIRARDEEELDL
jgi:hypothetical protein